MEDDDYGFDASKGAKYNDGLLQVIRIDKLTQIIALCDSNLLGISIITGDYNYKLKFTSLNSQVSEAWDRLKPKEKENIEKKRKILNQFEKEKPIIEYMIDERKPKHLRTTLHFNEENWNLYSEKLLQYQRCIRIYLAKHGLSSPSIDDDEGMF